MRVLALETTRKTGSVATLAAAPDNARPDALEIKLDPAQPTARSLTPAIRSIVARNGWTLAEIDLICVAAGPGSFTGLRIGVTAAKTASYALGLPLVAVNTLAAMLVDVRAPGRIWSVQNAQRKQLFAACFARAPSAAEPRLFRPTVRVIDIEAWIAELAPGDAVVGPPVAKLRAQLPADLALLDAAEAPTATQVGRLGIVMAELGETVDPMQLTPDYGRMSAAEEKAADRGSA